MTEKGREARRATQIKPKRKRDDGRADDGRDEQTNVWCEYERKRSVCCRTNTTVFVVREGKRNKKNKNKNKNEKRKEKGKGESI